MSKYEIYQLDWSADESVIRNFAFRPFQDVIKDGFSISKDRYSLVYTMESETDLSLEDLYYIFNMERPADFKGHSLSVSDVVGNSDGFWYCDSFGWKRLDWEREFGKSRRRL